MIQMTNSAQGAQYETASRGVQYLATQLAGRWCVLSTRFSGAGFGQARWFDTLEEVEANIKAFRGLAVLAA